MNINTGNLFVFEVGPSVKFVSAIIDAIFNKKNQGKFFFRKKHEAGGGVRGGFSRSLNFLRISFCAPFPKRKRADSLHYAQALLLPIFANFNSQRAVADQENILSGAQNKRLAKQLRCNKRHVVFLNALQAQTIAIIMVVILSSSSFHLSSCHIAKTSRELRIMSIVTIN